MLLACVLISATGNNAQPPAASWQADPELVRQLSERRSEFNYDESQVPDYRLPDPLVFAGPNQERVSNAKQWRQKRRPQLMELFRSEVYGHRPQTPHRIRYEEVARIDDAFDGAATGRQIRVSVSAGNRQHQFDFVLFVPKSSQPAPVIVHINNRYFIDLETAAEEHDPFWPADTIIQQGYATASFHTKHVDPDRADGYSEGIRAVLDDPQSDPDTRWKSLSAWGWAASRVLDFAADQEGVDGQRAAVVGHSRGGKTALWAAAEDPRFDIAYSNDSGCGGAALSRRAYGETVGKITSSFPHWFSDRFARYADREGDLPVDQHELIALIAPRAVYVASADRDLWADPRGEYLSLVEAAPVFELLGQAAITTRQMPPLDQPRHVGATGYHIRSGKHNLTDQDWGYFLDFVDQRWQP
jgi:pimeloyl-ACP methyl ester carboxylesterase